MQVLHPKSSKILAEFKTYYLRYYKCDEYLLKMKCELIEMNC